MANNYKPLFVFSHPRVASNLFMHLLANDPQIAQLTYLFFESFYSGPDSISQHRSTKVASTTKEQNAHPSYQEAFDAVTDFINVAQTQVSPFTSKTHRSTLSRLFLWFDTLTISRTRPHFSKSTCIT